MPEPTLSPLESALISEIRRSNDQMLNEFRRVADYVTRDEDTDPSRKALRAEVDSWPTRLRLTLNAFGAGVWTNFKGPISTAVTVIALYYLAKLTGQTPTPSPLQVESTVLHAPAP